MRILRSVVAPSAAFMAFCDSKIPGCSSIRSEVICDQLVRGKAIFLQQLAHQFERRPLVPPGLDQHIKNFALGVNGSPEIDQATIDLEIDLVEMPDGVRLRPAFTQVSRDHGSKMVHPATHRLIGNHDSAFRQQILDVAEAQGEPDIKPDRLLDNLGRETVAAKADLGHHQWLRLKSRNGKPTDNVTMPSSTLINSRGASGKASTRLTSPTIDLCQSGPVRVSEAIKEVYYEHRKESCSHHLRVARYRCGPRQGIS